MFTEDDQKEITTLIDKILDKAFLFISSKNKDSDPKNRPFYRYNKMRFIKSGSIVPERLFNIDIEQEEKGEYSPALEDMNNAIRDFVMEIALELFDHKKRISIFADDKVTLKEQEIQAVENFLNSKGFSSKSISEAKKPLEKDLDKRIKRFLNDKESRYFYPETMQEHYWLGRENELIQKLIDHYRQFPKASDFCAALPTCKQLSEREILSNMAIIFAATGFWGETDDARGLFEKLRQRVRKIKNETDHQEQN